MSTTETTDTELYSHDPGLNEYVIEDEGPEELKEMFRRLRENNIVTIEGRSCCGGCTAGAADNHATDLEAEGHEVKGAAYYHEQDLNECWDHKYEEGFCTYDTDSLYLGFGGRRDTSTAEVAGLIMEAAYQAGLEAEWDGNTRTRILVKMD